MHETKQVYFNQVKGVIIEVNNTTKFPSVVITAGHENKRSINISFKPEVIKEVVKNYKLGDYIAVKFFVSSRFKHNRWYTMINALEVI